VPFQGVTRLVPQSSQGVALGWILAAFQAEVVRNEPAPPRHRRLMANQIMICSIFLEAAAFLPGAHFQVHIVAVGA
jgi:hypothetical protein